MAFRGVKRVVTAHQQREGGGFVVRRPVGGQLSMVDPFLMLDHLGPVEYAPGEAVGAPDHPHRGFETVTYVLDGGFHHQDSTGCHGDLRAGWVQWMTAGRGVVHSEMPTEELLRDGGRMEGFQLWVNLPAKDKMIAPRYQDTPPEKLPIYENKETGVWVRIIAGESMGTKATIETHTPMTFLDIALQPGSTHVEEVPENFDGFVYCYRGAGHVGGAVDKEGSVSLVLGQVALLDAGSKVTLRAAEGEELRVLLIAGQPIKEPVARYGPFVMNTREEIMQAFSDYDKGKLGAIEGAEERYAKTKEAVAQQKKTGTWSDEL